MFSELASSFFSVSWLTDEKTRELEAEIFSGEYDTLWCVKLFSYVFLWKWRYKGLVVLKFERCEHRDDTSIVDGDQEGVKC